MIITILSAILYKANLEVGTVPVPVPAKPIIKMYIP